MDFIHEYALLVVVVIPVAALAGLNVFLWASGERRALLVPVPHAFSRVDAPACAESFPQHVAPVAAAESANDDFDRKAA